MKTFARRTLMGLLLLGTLMSSSACLAMGKSRHQDESGAGAAASAPAAPALPVVIDEPVAKTGSDAAQSSASGSVVVTEPVPAPAPVVITTPVADINVGSFDDGIDVGTRNGTLIAERVYKKLIGSQGCAAVGQLQSALRQVASSIKAPAGGSRFVAGFFSGYVGAIRKAIRDARTECGSLTFSLEDGAFPGELSGTVFCQLASQDAVALSAFEFSPIYNGWSDQTSVRDACLSGFSSVVAGCAVSEGLSAELLMNAQTSACAE